MSHTLLPDLLAIPATDFVIQRVRYRGSNYRLLRFSQSFGNIGEGPLQVRRGDSDAQCPGENRAAGYQDVYLQNGTVQSVRLKDCMVFHPAHDHWHLANVARYDLYRVDVRRRRLAGKVATSDKVSFCLFDEHRLDSNQYNGPVRSQTYTDCNARITGITPGWADEYSYRVYGQWLVINGLPDGIYYLLTTVDPSNQFVEVTRRNNRAGRLIRIYNNGRSVRALS